ncbi:hypothetical protein BCR43DRAFT_491735 [Syncephalastrum racemosum]|uniref:BRCT domain-containing protein n=1 Tax=Syncephalastrum racemosum TaxID=13706 RepID=A0A1X2HCE7_SYNRA|nr:hypothetical protein BCR43DRAFT_491735 [Syncephalastrum racemosum]
MARDKLAQHHKLFSGYSFVLMKDTMDAKQCETLQELIQLGGGRVVSCLDRGPAPQEIIVGRSMKAQEARMISFGAGKHPLVWHWIINSVGSYDLHKKQPYRAGEGKYCLP